jgi:tetrapyrrole methylase family protein/MazG family protein
LNFQKKDTYTIEDLVHIVEILRAPGGCPWDREQTHQSIRNNFLEETYEAVEAIDSGDTVLLQEELGDVLLQVLFHSQLEKEKGGFSFADVADGISKKLILRHPHVFGDISVKNTEEVLKNWEAIKQKSKGRKSMEEILKGVSPALPALMRAQKLQKKACPRADSEEISFSLRQVREKTVQLEQAVQSGQNEKYGALLGDMLFDVVAVFRSLDMEAEEMLARSCDRFISRFEKDGQDAAAEASFSEGSSDSQ